MIRRNEKLAALKQNYLFPEINLRKRKFLESRPGVRLISLGIGDTTEPIPLSITQALVGASEGLGSPEGYTGYGEEKGEEALREKIAAVIYKGSVTSEEVFVSDGAKCDIARLQVLFGGDLSVAVQNPAYPVYVDGSIIQGIKKIHFLPHSPDNNFFPDLARLPRVDLLYLCSPNNPVGFVYTRPQLEEFVAYARRNRSIIIFDSAYAAYIQDPELPRSIYEIEGAREVAIEVGSFSKSAGFTGVRLGWSVLPEALKYSNGMPVRNDWDRVTSTLFNGASNIAQKGGLAVLEAQGLKEIDSLVDFYLGNARLIKTTLEQMGYTVFGGINAPYLWLSCPGKDSWEVFQQLLEEAHIVSTPGSGFGSSGQGFIRLSAYGRREDIALAVERLKKIRI